MPDVVLIRPGCTDYDEQQRIQGSLDLPLSPRGQEQVDELIEQLANANLEIIYTSSCEPARSTAAAIGQSLNIPVKEKKGLRSLDQGLWQGQKLDDICRQYPKVFKQWQESPETICPPEGEPIWEALDRVRNALQKPMKRKTTFGLVVAEPLASLISHVVMGGETEFVTPTLCGCSQNSAIEWFKPETIAPST